MDSFKVKNSGLVWLDFIGVQTRTRDCQKFKLWRRDGKTQWTEKTAAGWKTMSVFGELVIRLSAIWSPAQEAASFCLCILKVGEDAYEEKR